MTPLIEQVYWNFTLTHEEEVFVQEWTIQRVRVQGWRFRMEKTEFRLAKVGVVMLGVRDIARSLGFYRDKLGLEVQHEIPGFAFLNGGGVTLCLSEAAVKARGQAAGAGEIVFSVQEVSTAYEALKGKGVQFTHEPRSITSTARVANFDDPDGNHLSIYGP